MRRSRVFAGALALACLLAQHAPAAREFGGRYSQEKLANAKKNCDAYEWARKMRDDATRAADPWLKKSDEELWQMIPGQDLPRCIDVTLDRSKPGVATRVGCLKCGEKIFAFGNYPYDPDFEKLPWKLTCPSCKSVFPTNDFGKYYASGMNEQGVFDPKRADKSLLFNTEHPDPADPLHNWGVDDGFGYIDETGHPHRYVGYYTWKYWRYMIAGLNSLATAYVYSGDVRYAHKAAIMLDRIADVYPSMDWRPYAKLGFFHSDGNRIAGKIEGAIWETQTATNLSDSYDKILSGTVNDPELFAFLKRKSEQFKIGEKGTRELFVAHCDKNLLQEVHDGILSEQISGNEGMQQRAMMTAALALNTQPSTNQWLDWLFEPRGGAIPGMMLNHIDRDGASDEAVPGYAYFFGLLVGDLASILKDYPQYTNHDLFREFPQFARTYTIAYRMAALGYATPNMGDSGRTGLLEAHAVNPKFMADGYRHTRDAEIAVAAWRANGNSAEGLGRDIFAADPDALAREIEALGKAAGPRPIGSDLMSGFGVALLESGTSKDNGIAVPVQFGRTTRHSHLDHLNFDLLTFGSWLLPDHGYPEFATRWPSRDEWTINTLSHNDVVVDQKPQKVLWTGYTKLFKSLPGLQVVTLDGPHAYPQTTKYQRTVLLVDAPGTDHYVVDLFRVEGGKDHLFSVHGPPCDPAISGLKLTPQATGTYAGPNIAPETTPGDFPLGYSWLFDVRRDNAPPNQFMLDWKPDAGYRQIKSGDDIHIRFHALTQCDDVALALGKPPQTKEGNPKTLPYALLHRAGDNLKSDFVSVFEPYRAQPFIRTISLNGEGGSKKVRVELVDGSVDTIAFDEMNEAGRISLVREQGGAVKKAILINGSTLKAGAANLAGKAALEGHVKTMNKQLEGGGWIVVDAELPTDGSLEGQYIVIDTKNERNACYAIRKVTKVEGGSRIDCGPITFVKGYVGETFDLRGQELPTDYSRGYAYDFEEGDAFRIPLHQIWNAEK